jgi:hypothetical protein
MRMAFGLLGILVTLGVLVWVLAVTLPETQRATHTAKVAKDQTKQIAGYDQDMTKAADTISLDGETSGGKFNGVLVTAIKSGGAMERHFGLQRNDSIIKIGPLGMQEIGSADAAKDFLVDAFQRNQELLVVRNGKQITLPATAANGVAGAATPAPGADATNPPAAAPAGDTEKSSVQRQLDAIQKVPSH